MVGENFFPWGECPCHQINLCYLVSLIDESQIRLDGSFKAIDELGNERMDLNMCWVSLKDIPNIMIYPTQVKEYIINIPDQVVHFIYKE